MKNLFLYIVYKAYKNKPDRIHHTLVLLFIMNLFVFFLIFFHIISFILYSIELVGDVSIKPDLKLSFIVFLLFNFYFSYRLDKKNVKKLDANYFNSLEIKYGSRISFKLATFLLATIILLPIVIIILYNRLWQ
jgi:hypothetical protein